MAKKSNGQRGVTNRTLGSGCSAEGIIEPADYKRYVLPIIFLRFLSLRYERRRAELDALGREPQSEYFTSDEAAARRRSRGP